MSLHNVRLKSMWVALPVYVIFARPTMRLVVIGVALAAIGWLIRGWAAGTIHKNYRLTTTGPYAFTRNPLYLGTFFLGLGLMAASGRLSFLLVFLVFFVVVYGRTMLREERRLERMFGDEFREYAARVPRFIPRVTPRGWRHFDFSRYLANSEYNSALGVGLVFLVLVAKIVW